MFTHDQLTGEEIIIQQFEQCIRFYGAYQQAPPFITQPKGCLNILEISIKRAPDFPNFDFSIYQNTARMRLVCKYPNTNRINRSIPTERQTMKIDEDIEMYRHLGCFVHLIIVQKCIYTFHAVYAWIGSIRCDFYVRKESSVLANGKKRNITLKEAAGVFFLLG